MVYSKSYKDKLIIPLPLISFNKLFSRLEKDHSELKQTHNQTKIQDVQLESDLKMKLNNAKKSIY